MLFNPEAFEALTDEPWDEDRARAAIRTVVNDADAAFDPDGLCPANEWDAWRSTPPLKDLYVGAAGVAWALDALRRRDFAETRLDLAAAAGSALELWAEAPDLAAADLPLPRPSEPSLLCGEGGILLVAWRLSPREELADRLLARVRENVANEAEELMWGAPGTMLAAHAMHGWTGEERWAEAWRGSAGHFTRVATQTGSGRNGSTADRRPASSVPYTASSETCTRCCSGRTRATTR